jgi:hypothetical protein
MLGRKPEGVARRVAEQLVGRPLRKLGEMIHEALEKAEAHETQGEAEQETPSGAPSAGGSEAPSATPKEENRVA